MSATSLSQGSVVGSIEFTEKDQEEDEEYGLFTFAEELRLEGDQTGKVGDVENGIEERSDSTQLEDREAAKPWFMEMGRLRRMHFLYLNKQLALSRKSLLQSQRAKDADMKALGILLHEQAEAIRDLEYIRTLDWLSPDQQDERYRQSVKFFPYTGSSKSPGVFPFLTENYRCLHPETQQFTDGVRGFLLKRLPVWITYTKEEKSAREGRYKDKLPPKSLSHAGEVIARFLVASVGALFILVPMYIMAFDTSRTKNLVTTTIAVVLFAIMCSITLRTTNDQTLSATAGYAAVLFVFVGLTSSAPQAQA